MTTCRHCGKPFAGKLCPACLTPRFVQFAQFAELTRGEITYSNKIRGAVKALFDRQVSGFAFVDTMFNAVRDGLRAAWLEGAAMSGIKPDELTPAEERAIQDAANASLQRVLSLQADILRRRDLATLDPSRRERELRALMGRVGLWDARYEQARSGGLAMTAGNQKLIWIWDPRKDHCRSCSALNGKVKRRNFWWDNGILPQVPNAWYLTCGGFSCGCRLRPTDEPISRGRMPNLP